MKAQSLEYEHLVVRLITWDSENSLPVLYAYTLSHSFYFSSDLLVMKRRKQHTATG